MERISEDTLISKKRRTAGEWVSIVLSRGSLCDKPIRADASVLVKTSGGPSVPMTVRDIVSQAILCDSLHAAPHDKNSRLRPNVGKKTRLALLHVIGSLSGDQPDETWPLIADWCQIARTAHAHGDEEAIESFASIWSHDARRMAANMAPSPYIWLSLPISERMSNPSKWMDMAVEAIKSRWWPVLTILCENNPDPSGVAAERVLLSNGFAESLSDTLLSSLRDESRVLLYGGQWRARTIENDVLGFAISASRAIRGGNSSAFLRLMFDACRTWMDASPILSASETMALERAALPITPTTIPRRRL